ncbi:hypothetical protein JAAARDRAFT_188297 [Jaapia argillacea MUCL 33604]|uniref:MARVEL domain-containing protein n=1 Tax=Jaapia argillacea MUCL 33604 TaxID=933084 RepID=A0A067QQU2_9AGAM|nr:hypothetical protein JAAARDRAFT_188297 [Jaapia argillacea MUCL 33604]
MAFMPIFRYTVFGATLFMSIIVLAMASDFLTIGTTYIGAFYYFTAVAIAAAVLTLLTLPAMIILDITRKGAFTSKIVVELVWLSILWAFWLATAAYTAYSDSVDIAPQCDYLNSDVQRGCNEWKTAIAFSFLIWLTLMGYTATLLIFAINSANRGNPVWSTSVSDNLFSRPAVGGKVEVPTGYHPTDYGGQPPSNPSMMAAAYPPSTPSYAPYPPSQSLNVHSPSHNNGGYVPTASGDGHQYPSSQSPTHNGYQPVPMSVNHLPQV